MSGVLRSEVARPRHDWLWHALVGLALTATAGTATLLVAAAPPCSAPPPPPTPVVATAPPPAPAPTPPPDANEAIKGLIDEPIKLVAAASDAPVIALGSEQHVWISRDDGKTFARALDSAGKIESLFVEPDGRVYVVRIDNGDHGPVAELGVAEPDGRERWREPPSESIPLDARAGWIVGMASRGGMVVGWDVGNKWDRIPASRDWNPWRMTMGAGRVSRYLATKIGAPEGGMHLLAAREAGRAKVLWSVPSADGVGGPDSVVPCAGFAGDTLHLVVRGHTPGSSRLVAVGPDGRAREQALVGQLLDDRELTCEIAGNDRAAYLTLHTYRTLDQVMRIDGAGVRDVAAYGFGFDRLAVDAHGNLLFLAHGCVIRLTQASRQTQLACGPDRR